MAPKKYWDLYDRDAITPAANPFAPKQAPKQALHQFNELRGYTGIPDKGPVPEDTARALKHGYYACVSFADAMIGRILDELDRLKMREDTIVILWGDHGWQLGEHALWCKHANFNTSLQAPLLVSAPGFSRESTSPALVEFVDIYPTLCELAGLPLPDHLQGTSFVPLLRKPGLPWKKAVFARYHQGDSVRTDRFLYTVWRENNTKRVEHMLYDHANDPAENINLADKAEWADTVKEMNRLLQEGHEAVRPPLSSR